ncbi:MAG: ATP-binding protein [Treponema sp.]|uniref:ATP-binding protein n=1 Tax=Treponema sp. TaxID=166 RepID=UPI0025E3CD1D|nr:AAA family ATPase [Treponema sp.]MBR0495023.1 ATP-binding protein [Treponema sp.]
MYRKAFVKLAEWKASSRRKPLILKGARQVGKTWLMKEFGRQNYEKNFYFSFEKDAELAKIFATNKDPYRIVSLLGAIKNDKIEKEKHLIIFDEIQECPDALNSLKYFCEDANEYHVVAAGSLLGTLLAEPMSYPVGKVNLLDVYPMDFEEFLGAVNPPLLKYLEETPPHEIISIQHTKLIEQYHDYLIVGGLPECVASWAEEQNSGTVLQIQKELLSLYENDIAKHNKKIDAGRILLVFKSLVTQLSKENEKFIYGCVKQGARAREFEVAIEWLVSAGLVLRIYDVKKSEHPLKAFEDFSSFKLFFFDVGLAKCAAQVENKQIVLDSDFQFKGALTENYCLQQFHANLENDIHYYSPAQNYEVDFLLQNEMQIIPVECKSGGNVTSASFKRYRREQQPELAIRLSQLEYKEQEDMINVPLYLADRINKLNIVFKS